MAGRIPVHKDGQWIYDIVMERSFEALETELKKLPLQGRKICIVTDSHVAPLYLEEVEEIAGRCCACVIHHIVPAGEEYKTLDTVRDVYERLILAHFDRYDMLLALGGGVIGDLSGYTAATYLRGIDFIQVPTTLLSQVDSSIGGKTGVDFDSYKNMVGAFHMPRLVYTNINTLATLTEEQYSSGMGEIVKHGLIKDADYYRWLESHQSAIWNRDVAVCEQMVSVSNEIKRAVVEKDPTEQGERALLNYGHTLGHAIEKLSKFQLMHGHCVGLGCISAMAISVHRGVLPAVELGRLQALMAAFHMPLTVGHAIQSGAGLSKEQIIETTKSDKKMDSGTIRFILLNTVGYAYIDKTVTADEMSLSLDAIL